MLLMAAGAQAAEAVGLCVAVLLNVIDSVSGDAWTTSNAIAFIALEGLVAAAVAWVAWGIARVRPWSRTPAVMTQVFTILIALWLLEAHRYGWGIPALLFAIAALAGLFAPTSLRALSRSASPGGAPRTPLWGAPAPHIPLAGLTPKPHETRGAASATPLVIDC
jgi:hypothetical protein